MIVLNYPQGSDDWLRARCGVITASRFGDARKKLTRASGEKKAGDPHGDAERYAWTVAVETIARQPLDDTFVNYAMRRGRDLEPIARQQYELRTDSLVEEASLVLTDDSRFGYSTDGLVNDDGLVEIKCPLSAEKLGNVWANPGAAHLEYLDQIDGGLWITGRKWCDLVIYCDWLKPVGKDLFVTRIFRNEDRIEALEADLLAFMRLVDQNLATLREPRTLAGRLKGQAPAPAMPAAAVDSAPPWDPPASPPPVAPARAPGPVALPESIF